MRQLLEKMESAKGILAGFFCCRHLSGGAGRYSRVSENPAALLEQLFATQPASREDRRKIVRPSAVERELDPATSTRRVGDLFNFLHRDGRVDGLRRIG